MTKKSYLNNTIWRNKDIHILSYAAETRRETSKTKRILETTEIVQRITGKTLIDKDVETQINDWVLDKKKTLNEHVHT